MLNVERDAKEGFLDRSSPQGVPLGTGVEEILAKVAIGIASEGVAHRGPEVNHVDPGCFGGATEASVDSPAARRD
jgi:hypothetical protein